jgi:DNA modification methylase
MGHQAAVHRKPKVVFRSVADLTLHPAVSLIPKPPARAKSRVTSVDLIPLEILLDGQIVSGREQYKQAQRAPRCKVPTVVVTVKKSKVEMYVLAKALDSQHFTDDQRACLAVEYASRMSAKMRKERAVKAAAVRYGRVASRSTRTVKQDARAEACKRFRVPPKKFRQVRKLVVGHPTLYHKVLDGTTTLKQARDQTVKALLLRNENERSAAGPVASPAGLILGDARTVIPTLPDDHFTALVTDPPYGVNFQQEWRGVSEIAVVGDKDIRQAIDLFQSVLAAAGPKMRRQAFLLTFVPAKYEPEFRSVITKLGWAIIAYPIWTKNTRMLYPHLNVASQHERMILAVRGGAKLRKPISDVFRHGKTHGSSHPCEKPVALLTKLIEALTVRGEAVLDPFCGSGATLIASKQVGRQAVGIEVDTRWHSEAVRRLRPTPTPAPRASTAQRKRLKAFKTSKISPVYIA